MDVRDAGGTAGGLGERGGDAGGTPAVLRAGDAGRLDR